MTSRFWLDSQGVSWAGELMWTLELCEHSMQDAVRPLRGQRLLWVQGASTRWRSGDSPARWQAGNQKDHLVGARGQELLKDRQSQPHGEVEGSQDQSS